MQILQKWRYYLRRDVYHVTDQAQWALYWVGYYVTEQLRARHALRTHLVTNAWTLRNQIIQFGDRYAYLHADYTRLHPSNVVFLTWFHGDLDDPNPDMQALFQRLPGALPYVTQINTSCNISRQSLLQVGVPPQKICLIPIGVDLSRFVPGDKAAARAALGIPADAVVIGSFQKDGQGWQGAGMQPKLIKGPDIFLETIALLQPHYPKLMVLLTGPARGFVKAGLEKLGVPYVHQQLAEYHQIVGCYHALDAYVISSRSEGGPKAMMESWGTGVPLVSTNMGMPADWLRHGENGMLAAVDDPVGLAAGVRALLDDPDLRGRCVAQAKQDVRALDWGRVADLYHAMYQPWL